MLNRFWVLERSVDVQGADLFIQRRLTGRNLLDREPPRLGMIQVKFFGTPGTSHFVHRECVVEDGEPRDEFFVLLFAATHGKSRRQLKQEVVASLQGISVKYTGEQLIQSDLDVWETLVHFSRRHPLGHVCQFSAHALLKALGRPRAA